MNKNIKNITYIAILSSIIAIVSPFTISIFVIPFSLSLFIIYIVGAISSKFGALLAVLIYIFLGIIGLPVFSSFSGGIGIILGITGGFIIGYLPCVLIVNLIVNINKKKMIYYIIGMLCGTLSCYVIGTVWYMIETNSNLIQSILICIVPYIVFDIIKIGLGSVVSYLLNNRFLNNTKYLMKK